MQSIKNFVVTLTLLGVGYGTYVALNQPIDGPVSRNAEKLWNQYEAAPDVTLPTEVEAQANQAFDDADLLQPPSVSGGTAALPREVGALESPTPVSAHTSELPGPALLPPAGETSGAVSPEIQKQSAFADYPRTNRAPTTLVPLTGQTDSGSKEPVFNETLEPVQIPDASVGPEPEPDIPAGSAIFTSVWNSVQEKLGQNELADALFTLSVWFQDSTLSAEQHEQCLDLLDQLAGTVIYSREHHLEPPYTVKAGEHVGIDFPRNEGSHRDAGQD